MLLFSNISKLEAYERKIYNQTFDEATYTWRYFKNDVIKTLQYAFGSSNVEIGNKSIKIFTEDYEVMLYHALSIEITCLLEIVKKIENIFLELNFYY